MAETNNTYIVGKDASLESSIAHMQQQLKKLGFHIEEHSWLNPLPHVWSVHIRDRGCPLLFTNGKGASKKAALASALGEFFERLATNYFWADYYLGDSIASAEFVHYRNERWFSVNENKPKWPDDLLTKELIDFYDSDRELSLLNLVDINTARPQRGVCTLPFIRQSDQKKVWFPVNIIGNLYVSNGMSAGNSINEARVQALSEILERHVKFKIIEEGICLPNVPDEVLQQYPEIQLAIHHLEQKGFGVLVKDASLGGKYPVINVTLLNPENQGCFASFGAHPRFQVALERSLTELLQGRELNTLNEFPAPIHDLDEVASQENLETHFIDSSGLISWRFLRDQAESEFKLCDFGGTTEEEFSWLCDLIHESGRDIYIADYDHLGVYACRILVPSMSEIYPADDLIWVNNNKGIAIREAILDIESLSAKQAEAVLTVMDYAEIDDIQLVASLIGLPIQKGTLWEDYRVAELKVLLAVISTNKDVIQAGCGWLLAFGQIERKRYQLYHCLWNLLMLNEIEYTQAFAKLYPIDVYKQAIKLLNGKINGFCFENLQHSLLIEAYEKLHSVK